MSHATPSQDAPFPAGGRTIEVTVSPAGEVTVQTRGFAGPACRDASRFVEQALGERTGERLTAEFHQPEAQSVRADQRA